MFVKKLTAVAVGYPHLNVKIGAVYGGISVGEAEAAVLSEKCLLRCDVLV